MKFNFLTKKNKRIYLDYAAATPVHPDVLHAMEPFWAGSFGNPSAVHADGLTARKAIEEARKTLSTVLAIRAADIIFTSGGTESNQLAIMGTIEQLRERGRTYADMEILSTRMEHPSVLETLSLLQGRGVTVTYIDSDGEGLIRTESIQKALSPQTVLLCFTYVNSEIGVVQDVKRISRIVRKYAIDEHTEIKIHLDASQAPLWLPCQMDMLGIDMMTLDSGKCYGPKGSGVLARRHGIELAPQMRGGGQEFGLRSGTENTPLIVGTVYAIVRAQKQWSERSEKVSELRDFFITALEKAIPEAVLNGSRAERVANNVNISIPGIDTEFAVITLDSKGISASTKSACSGARGAGSKVVLAMTGDTSRAESTIRFTLGESTTRNELTRVVDVLSTHVKHMQTFKNAHKS